MQYTWGGENIENEIKALIAGLEEKLHRKLTDSEKTVANYCYAKGFEEGMDTCQREISIDMFM